MAAFDCCWFIADLLFGIIGFVVRCGLLCLLRVSGLCSMLFDLALGGCVGCGWAYVD